MLETSHYNDAVPDLKGKVLTIRFEVEGRELLALNGVLISLAGDFAVGGLREPRPRSASGRRTGRTSEALSWAKDRFDPVVADVVPRPMIEMLQGPDAAGAAPWRP